MRGATFNLLFGRRPSAVTEELWALFRSEDLAFCCTQETGDYVEAIRDAGLRVIGRGESCIVVHPRIAVARRRRFSYGDGWTTVRGGHHPPVVMWQADLAGWLRVRSVHLPTPSAWPAGRLEGPTERVDDLRAAALGLRSYLARPGARLAAGDWNEPPETRGVYSPHWIAGTAGAEIDAPRQGSGHGRIDYVMSRGCVVVGARVVHGLAERSDHDPVTFHIRRPVDD